MMQWWQCFSVCKEGMTAVLLQVLGPYLSINRNINGSHLATMVGLPGLHAALADLYVVMRDLHQQVLQLS